MLVDGAATCQFQFIKDEGVRESDCNVGLGDREVDEFVDDSEEGVGGVPAQKRGVGIEVALWVES